MAKVKTTMTKLQAVRQTEVVRAQMVQRAATKTQQRNQPPMTQLTAVTRTQQKNQKGRQMMTQRTMSQSLQRLQRNPQKVMPLHHQCVSRNCCSARVGLALVLLHFKPLNVSELALCTSVTVFCQKHHALRRDTWQISCAMVN